MTAQVAILVPVLGRPHRVMPLVENIDAVTPEDHRTVFIVSANDDAERDALTYVDDRPGVAVLTVPWDGGIPGDYARKINAGFRFTDEPYLFQGADDVRFHAGWFHAAWRQLGSRFCVCGTNDLYNPRVLRGAHSTHSLFTRSYIDKRGTVDEVGKVLHEGYPHEYCDDEFVRTARSRGVFCVATDSIVEHLHPYAGKAPRDWVYDLGHSRVMGGKAVFEARERMWEPLPLDSISMGVGSRRPELRRPVKAADPAYQPLENYDPS